MSAYELVVRRRRTGTVLLHPGGRTFADAGQLWLAWMTDNRSDVHGNAAAAEGGAFGGLIVLGALTAAVVIGLAQPAEGPAQEGFHPPT